MFQIRFYLHLMMFTLFLFTCNGCYRPPYNNFRPYNPVHRDAALGAAAGAAVGAAMGSAPIGTAVGAAAFTGYSLIRNNRANIIRDLQRKGDIRFEQYGDTMTLIIPTDRYFLFNSPKFNPLCYASLYRIIRLLKYYPGKTIYIAGFTDDVGSRKHKNYLTQARAETMLTFLWAWGIPSELLRAEGYGSQHDVSENKTIRGSAHNRRLELQWFQSKPPLSIPNLFIGPTK